MKQPDRPLGIIIPVYNEAEIIEKNVKKLISFCEKNNFQPEILLCENGSKDNSREIIEKLKDKRIKKVYVENKGLGGAYLAGIKAAESDIIYFTGMDFPFGYQNILECYSYIDKHDLVLASKAHRNSIIKINFKRRISSKVYQTLVRTALGMKTKDAQGCAMFRLEKVSLYLKYCDSIDAFFQTQIALYGEVFGLSVLEIPVKYINARSGSKFSVVSDGWQMMQQIMRERKKIKRISKSS